MKNQKGITLIALVITIIVLLILAGVSIAMLTGQNGILTQATKAQDETKIAEIAENVNLSIAAAYAASQAPGSSAKFDINAIVSELDDITGNTNSGSGTTISYKDGSDTYTVTLKSDLRAIDTNEDGSYKISK